MNYFNRLAKQSPESFGISLKIASGIAFATMFGLIKYLGDSIPVGQIVFARSAFALIPLIIFLFVTSDFPAGLKTQHPGSHIARCLFGTIAMFCTFSALRYLPIAEATAISYLSPVVLVVFAVVLLKEKVSPRRLWGVALGLLGLVIITVPNFTVELNHNTLIGIGYAFVSAVLIAAALLQVRQLSQMGENPATITFYFALTSTVISFIIMFSHWQMPTAKQWLCLVSIGLVGGVAQIVMTMAYQYAEASAMAPYEYLAIVWAVIIGMVAFAEVPNWVFWIAMPLILFGGFIAKPRSRQ